jgi:hypothetical protein
MAYSSQTERETQNDERRRKWDQEVFGPSGRPTPRYLDTDNPDHYLKRLMDAARPLVAVDLQEVKTQDLYCSALNHYEQRYFDSAKAEAQRPTNIPAGELRQVTKHDQSGRPFYEFHGSPSSWMKQFMPDTVKKLANIRTETDRGYHINNLYG